MVLPTVGRRGLGGVLHNIGPRSLTAYRRQYRRPNYPVFRTLPYQLTSSDNRYGADLEQISQPRPESGLVLSHVSGISLSELFPSRPAAGLKTMYSRCAGRYCTCVCLVRHMHIYISTYMYKNYIYLSIHIYTYIYISTHRNIRVYVYT